MHFRAITRIVGLLVILFSGTMIIPGLVALIYRDGAGRALRCRLSSLNNRISPSRMRFLNRSPD